MEYIAWAVAHLGLWGLMLLSAAGIGGVLLRRHRFDSTVERVVFTTALGLGSSAVIIFLLGLAGLMYRGVLIGFTIPWAIFALVSLPQGVELGSYIVVKMDGDGQMPPEHLSSLLDAIIDHGYDYAKGNRFLTSESLAQMPRERLLGNIVLTFLTKLASGYWHIFDPQNGYTAIKAEALRMMDLDTIHKRFFFENDILVHLNLLNLRVRDVAIPARYGDEDSDVIVFKTGLTFPLLLLRRYFRRIYQKYVLRDFSPIALFLFFGMAMFSWGLIFGFCIWIKSYVTGHAAATGTIMLALLPLILGFQLLLQAFVMDVQETPK